METTLRIMIFWNEKYFQ